MVGPAQDDNEITLTLQSWVVAPARESELGAVTHAGHYINLLGDTLIADLCANTNLMQRRSSNRESCVLNCLLRAMEKFMEGAPERSLDVFGLD